MISIMISSSSSSSSSSNIIMVMIMIMIMIAGVCEQKNSGEAEPREDEPPERHGI